MPLRTHWRDLDEATVAGAPNRYGVVEFGDADGEVVAVESGMLRDELKTGLAYRDAPKVRWEEAQTRERASELAAEQRERLDE